MIWLLVVIRQSCFRLQQCSFYDGTIGSSSDGDHEQFEFLSGLSERKVNEVLLQKQKGPPPFCK